MVKCTLPIGNFLLFLLLYILLVTGLFSLLLNFYIRFESIGDQPEGRYNPHGIWKASMLLI